MTKRQVFYSFHYKPDCWRTSEVRNIGIIEGNKLASDNEWETIINAGESEIKGWIKEQMKGRSCTVVLVGKNTAKRKWIDHEIIESWNAKMGIVGIYIHGLKDQNGHITEQGKNPFDSIIFRGTDNKLSSVVKCYNPTGNNSKEIYDWISKHISDIIEEAIKIRKKT